MKTNCYRFPPFPQVPVGVNIVAFRAFQPAGILQNDDIDEEVDGLGVRTVALPVQHGDVNGTGTKNAKKRRRAQAEKNAREGIKLRWDEQWEEADRSAPRRAYNPCVVAARLRCGSPCAATKLPRTDSTRPFSSFSRAGSGPRRSSRALTS